MKYCLNNRQSPKYLELADEIKAEYRDYKSFPDLIEKYPNKTIICQIYSYVDEIDWKALVEASILAKGNFICCVGSYRMIMECIARELKFYYGFPITTFWELESLRDLGVEYVRLGAPLFFQMDKVKQYGVPVRAVPNIAYLADLPHADGVCGTWIRPEDIPLYEDYIDAIEFEDCDNKKEAALWRVYSQTHLWPGFLNDLITNFNFEADNTCVHPTLGKHRLNCRQQCKETPGVCRLCHNTMSLANVQTIKKIEANLE